MKRILFLFILCCVFFSCKENTSPSSPPELDLLTEVSNLLEGEFNNFQQVWQENTETDVHRVTPEIPHQHIHSKFEKISIKETDDPIFIVTHTEGRDSLNILERSAIHLKKDGNQVVLEKFQIPENQDIINKVSNLGDPVEKLTWQRNGKKLIAQKNNETVYSIHGDTLFINRSEGILKNIPSDGYRLLRCRFFSGWIQYPLPENPNSIYSLRNLKIHDQGGITQLKLGDGTMVDFSVELTQLVFGKKISIMKLAVYEMPEQEVEWNSRSSSYAWTSPKAKRLGINLRKVLSGWTLIEPNYINSNNTKFKE